jgi:hypothetical protein
MRERYHRRRPRASDLASAKGVAAMSSEVRGTPIRHGVTFASSRRLVRKGQSWRELLSRLNAEDHRQPPGWSRIPCHGLRAAGLPRR